MTIPYRKLMIRKDHESESLEALRWLTLAIAVALGILPFIFCAGESRHRVGPESMDLLKLRTIEIP